MEAELSSEVGPAGRLFKGNVDLFWALLQRVNILKFEDSQKKALRDEFGKLYFWGDGYYPYEGRLDTIMEYSSRLRSRVLSVLTEIGDILCNEKSGLFGLVNGKFGDEKLDQQRLDVRSLVEMIQASLNDSDNEESDSGSFSSDGNNGIDDIIWELRRRNQCLMDLRASLERPAPDADINETEAPATERFQVSGPAEIWTRKILDTNPALDLTLAGRLGESNWQRYQRVSEKMEAMEDMDSEEEEEDDDNVGDLPIFSEGTVSTRDQSSIFSASGVGSSSQGPTTATSVSQTHLEYAFPRARKRKVVAKDTRSQATYTSRVTDDRGERGWLRIPKLPIEDKDLGNPFRCTVCGEKQQDITSRADWKKHVFADIQPYICTFPDCKDSLKTYTTRKLWADHEFTVHRFEKVWKCTSCTDTLLTETAMKHHLNRKHNYSHLTDIQLSVMVKARESTTASLAEDSKCPFCSELPGKTSRAFAMHVARHMEEIALAVLPREDADSDYEGGSISSSHSLPEILGPEEEPEVKETDPSEEDKKSGEMSKQEKPPITDAPTGGDDNEPVDSTGKSRLSLEQFNFLATIGKGNFGKVILAETKAAPKKVYAVKIYKKEFIIENDEVMSARSERNVFRLVSENQHPFLVQMIGSFQTETRLYYVTEYIAGGDLMLHIQRGKFSTDRSILYAAEVLLGLKFLHEKGVIYRDVKLDNVLVALDGHVKLTDFGLCKEDMWYGSTTKTFCGTPEFMGPEILLDKQYGRAVDWWALGVLIYQMLLQQSPFRGEDEDEIYDAILADEPLYPIHMSRESVNILQRLLERDPDRRLGSGITDAQEIQNHPFFKNIIWDDVYHKRYTPEFIPAIANEVDVSNFDTEFTTITPVLTPVQSALSAAMQEEFAGFSWVAPKVSLPRANA